MQLPHAVPFARKGARFGTVPEAVGWLYDVPPSNLVGMSFFSSGDTPQVQALWVGKGDRALSEIAEPVGFGAGLLPVQSVAFLRAVLRPPRLPFLLVCGGERLQDIPGANRIVTVMGSERLRETESAFFIRPQNQTGETRSWARAAGGVWHPLGSGGLRDVRPAPGAEGALWGRDAQGNLWVLPGCEARACHFGMASWRHVATQRGVRMIPARYDPACCPLSVDSGIVYVDVRRISEGLLEVLWGEDCPGVRVVGELRPIRRTSRGVDPGIFLIEIADKVPAEQYLVRVGLDDHGLPSFRQALAPPVRPR